jgi:hypothetical protein
MGHCIVAIFSDLQGEWADHTNWGTEFKAYAELKKLLIANQNTYPTWIGWSYSDKHSHNGSSVTLSLNLLPEFLAQTFNDTVHSRRTFKLTKPKFQVTIYGTQRGIAEYGFVYAKIGRQR